MERNRFNQQLRTALQRQRAPLSRHPQSWVDGAWRQACDGTGASQPALLQNPRLVVDATDHGIGIYPLIESGRCYLRCAVSAVVKGTSRSSHRRDDLDGTGGAGHRTATFGVGRFELDGPAGLPTRVWVHDELPLIVQDVAIPDNADRLELVLAITRTTTEGPTVLVPEPMPLFDPGLSHNNSLLPDPPRPTDLEPCVVVVAVQGRPLDVCGLGPLPAGDPVILADRTFARDDVLVLRTDLPDSRTVQVAIAVVPDAAAALAVLDTWASADGEERHAAEQTWPRRCAPLAVSGVTAQVDRQLPYAVYHSLAARSTTDLGRSIFVHGRRDRGYADAACLHQSYQMHLPALACGWSDPVREELLAFASLQDDRGYLSRQPRPGAGWHAYAGQYTNAHFVLAMHRYLSWTGDADLLDTPVASVLGARTTRTVRQRVEAALGWLTHRLPFGLVPPCGWCDAWPPAVVAQGQVSAATVLALRRGAELTERFGDPSQAQRWTEHADRITQQIRQRLLDPDTGLVAEHVYRDGSVIGNAKDDFWVPTQIWAVHADVVPDPDRTLDMIGRYCFDRGLRAITLASAERPYLAASTDNLGELSLDSTMTWLAATWPELTHLYAFALAALGRPDDALKAVTAQMPATLAEDNPAIPTHFYAEKYLYPGDEPWLCTWAGDPTLVEVVLCGLAGVRPELDGVTFHPAVPTSADGHLHAGFRYRGQAIDLHIHGTGTTITAMTIDGRPRPHDTPLIPQHDARIDITLAPVAAFIGQPANHDAYDLGSRPPEGTN